MALPRIPNIRRVIDPTEYPDLFIKQVDIRHNGFAPTHPKMSLKFNATPFSYDLNKLRPGDDGVKTVIPDLYAMASQYARVGGCMAEFLTCLAHVYVIENSDDKDEIAMAMQALSDPDVINLLESICQEYLNRSFDCEFIIAYLPMLQQGREAEVRALVAESEEARQ